MKYRGRLPDESTVLADVQKYLDAITLQAEEAAVAEKQAVVDAQKAALATMEFSVVDTKGLPIEGAVVKVVDAETKEDLGTVAAAVTEVIP